jgi:glycine hydroxymethyltransferase
MANTNQSGAPAATPYGSRANSIRVPGRIILPGAAPAAFPGDPPAAPCAVQATLAQGVEQLRAGDPALYALIAREHRRQAETLSMAAESGVADPAVLASAGSALLNTAAAGYPGARLQAGYEVADEVERLAIDRACRAFGARYANVQPDSGTSAVQGVMFSLLRPGDTVLGDPDAAVEASAPAVYFDTVAYGVDAGGRIDMEQVRRLALEHRPRLIVAGGSAYPRAIDFRAFREIADEAGAWLLADISDVAGLVAAGEHPSPIDHAHVTTTGTSGQLSGPRGGLVLMGRDHDAPAPDGQGTLSDVIQRAFPFFQGAPDLASVAGKAGALARVATPEFRALARRIAATAQGLAAALDARGYPLVSGGTDTHVVLVDVSARGLTGIAAQRALEACGIVADRSRVPGDTHAEGQVAGGVRFGTGALAVRGMGPAEMEACAALVDDVLSAVRPLGDGAYELEPGVAERARERVAALCARFPVPGYAVEPGPACAGSSPARVVTPFDPYALPVEEPA